MKEFWKRTLCATVISMFIASSAMARLTPTDGFAETLRYGCAMRVNDESKAYPIDIVNTATGKLAQDYERAIVESFLPCRGGRGATLIQLAGATPLVELVTGGADGQPQTRGTEIVMVDDSEESKRSVRKMDPFLSELVDDLARRREVLGITRLGQKQVVVSVDRLRFLLKDQNLWSLDSDRAKAIAEAIAVHEVGHSLGLNHDSDDSLVMHNPINCTRYVCDLHWSRDEILVAGKKIDSRLKNRGQSDFRE